jgi:hypothetical protein
VSDAAAEPDLSALYRETQARLAALNWTGDPAPVLDHLAVFGPAAGDIIE